MNGRKNSTVDYIFRVYDGPFISFHLSLPFNISSLMLFLSFAVFYTDDDIHFEWDQLAMLDKSIPHFELVSYEKSKTLEKFTSGINTRQLLFLVPKCVFC